ncbi:MAG: hypothetical protein ACYCSN_14640 [Acidobacteriaceae bacterium]
MTSLLDAADERALKRFMSMVDQQSRGTERRYTWDFVHGQFNTGNDTLELPSWARYFTLVVGSNANSAATLDSLTIEVNGLPELIAAGTTGSIGYSLLAGGGTLKITTSATSAAGQLYVRVADRVIGQVHGGSMPSVSLTGSLPAGNNAIGAMNLQSGASSVQATVKSAGGDGQSIGHALETMSATFRFNGTEFDRVYNNTQGTLLASAARTATTNSPTQTKYNGSAVVIFVNVTVVSGTGGITPKISSTDPVSGLSFDIWAASAAITTTGRNVYEVFPAAVTANNLIVPRTWGFTMSASDSSSYTYSVGFASDS